MHKPLSLVLLLAACRGGAEHPPRDGGPNEPPVEPPTVPPTEVYSDTTIGALALGAGDTLTLHDGAWLTVTGDAAIDGTVAAVGGPLRLRVEGHLTVGGSLVADAAGEADPTAPFEAATTGMTLVAEGGATFDDGASVVSRGNVVVTDSIDVLGDTPESWWTAAGTLDGDLPGLAPTDDEGTGTPQPPPLVRAAPTTGTPAFTISGQWDLSGLPGDRAVVLFHQALASGDLLVQRLALLPPAFAPVPDAESTESGTAVAGRHGRDGLNLSVYNTVGAVTLAESTLTLANGEDGQGAVALCAAATGGDGGKPGKVNLRGARGVQVRNTTIVPGRGGIGGDAYVTGTPGVDGAPGTPGCDVGPATGGDGGDSSFVLRAKGNVSGLDTLVLEDANGGNGGFGTALAEAGGSGNLGFDGGRGGSASASGGDGGDARVEAPGLAIARVGLAFGGLGGDATAQAGNGGDGGDCDPVLGTWGVGGAAGAATGTGGLGGAGDPGLPRSDGSFTPVAATPGTDGLPCGGPFVVVDAVGDAFDPASFVPGVGFGPSAGPAPELLVARGTVDRTAETLDLEVEIAVSACYEILIVLVSEVGGGAPAGAVPDPRDGGVMYLGSSDVCPSMTTIPKFSLDPAGLTWYPDGSVALDYPPGGGFFDVFLDLAPLPVPIDDSGVLVYARQLGGGADVILGTDGNGYVSIAL